MKKIIRIKENKLVSIINKILKEEEKLSSVKKKKLKNTSADSKLEDEVSEQLDDNLPA